MYDVQPRPWRTREASLHPMRTATLLGGHLCMWARSTTLGRDEALRQLPPTETSENLPDQCVTSKAPYSLNTTSYASAWTLRLRKVDRAVQAVSLFMCMP